MGTELVKSSPVSVPAVNGASSLPVLVERAGGAARFAWEEFFYAEHHNPHTQRAYESAVRRFLSWCEDEGGRAGQHLAGHGRPVPRRPGRIAGEA